MAGLYIHIPFCAQRCAYCDFHKSAGRRTKIPMLDALRREMEYRRGFPPGGRIDTVYVGGGTPSLLHAEELRSLLDTARGLWDCSEVKETTLEANPEDLTDGYIERLAGAGFDRLSIGIQSFDDDLLRLMNRRHDSRRAKNAVRAAQTAGFGNITIDLIFGIPGMTHEQWERSLCEASELGVQHISAYHLTIEAGTVFGRMAAAGKITAVPETVSERQYETLRSRLGEAGFEHYEISNFARAGFRAVHNSSYWNGSPYIGIGPSAHSYDGARVRSMAIADNDAYIAGAGTERVYEYETLSDDDLFNEFVMTALRRSDGLDTALLEHKFGAAAKEHFLNCSERFLRFGDMVEENGIFSIPPGRFLKSDYIMSAIFA